MKKLVLLSAMGLLVGLSQCTKPEVQEIAGSQTLTQTITLTADLGDGSKVSFNDPATGQLDLAWEQGDRIKVYEGSNTTPVGDLARVSGNTFTGDITATVGSTLTFRYGSTNDLAALNAVPAYTSQKGTLVWLKDNCCLQGTATCVASGSYNVTMGLTYAILKLDLSALGKAAPDNNVTISAGGSQIASVSDVTTSSKVVYVAMSANSTSTDYTFNGNGKEVVKNGWVLEANTFYTAEGSTPGTGTGAAIVIEPDPVEDEWIDFNDASMEVSGLPIWAKKNIGATNGATAESWYGNYYAWGETAGYNEAMVGVGASSGSSYSPGTVKTDYSWEWYKWGSGSSNLGKYVSKAGYGMATPDNILKLELADDVARQHASWGGDWRMPTGGPIDVSGAGEWRQLYSSTLWVWTGSYNDITDLAGYVVYKVKAKAHKGQCVTTTGNSGYTGYSGFTYALTDPHLFLPAAGYRNGTSLSFAGSLGLYWSSSLNSSNPSYAYLMRFNSGNVSPQYSDIRYLGFTVRPVR